MLYLKKLFLEERFYLSLVISMMLNTVCTRLVDQTDLAMMNRISENAAAALISVKGISFVDFVVALTAVPIIGVLLRKTDSQEVKERRSGVFCRKFLLCTIATTLFCAVCYPVLVVLSVKDDSLERMCLSLLPPLILNLPGKMMQFFFSTLLCVYGRANFVSAFWIATVVLNVILNAIFMRIFGYTGCIVSTVVVTLLVCLSFFFNLAKNFNLVRNFFSSEPCEFPFRSCFSEGGRIVVERISGYLFFILCIRLSTQSDFTKIGIIRELSSLFLVPFVACMRGASMSFSKSKNRLRQKMELGIVFFVLVTCVFFLFYEPIVGGVYKADMGKSNLWFSFKISFPILALSKSLSSVLRGFCNFELKQFLLFKVDTILTWCVFLPFCFALFFLRRPFLYPFVAAAQGILECAVLFHLYKRKQGRGRIQNVSS